MRKIRKLLGRILVTLAERLYPMDWLMEDTLKELDKMQSKNKIVSLLFKEGLKSDRKSKFVN